MIAFKRLLDFVPRSRWLLLAAGAVLAVFGAGCSVAKGKVAAGPDATEIFQLCQQCHGANGEGTRLANAPAIAGLPAWYVEAQLTKFKAGGRGKHFDDLTGMQMRPMALSLANEAEITAVAAHVAALPVARTAPQVEGGSAEHGQVLYATCAGCHGPDGAGLEASKAPPLTQASDWYLVSSLQKFKAGIRGTAAGDASGATMRPMAQLLADEQAIKDVVAYIVTLRK